MVLCPPHPAQTSSPGLDPFPDLDRGPAHPFPDLAPREGKPVPVPIQDGPAPPPSPVARAATAYPQATPGRIRSRRKRKPLVIAAALIAELALVAAVPHSWWHGAPSRLPSIHVKGLVPQYTRRPPKNVITQARARQRHRRQRIMRDIAIGSGAALAAQGVGKPPRHRQGSHPPHSGAPAPIPQAQRLPGLAALDKGQEADISGLSCPSAGNCAIDGFYYGAFYHGWVQVHVFVANEVHGRWHKATDVPRLAVLDPNADVSIGPVSCPSAGNCLAVGSYGRSGQATGFLAAEQDGTWRNAQPIPGLRSRLPQGSTFALSCASPGNCAFGGGYTPSAHHGLQAFADSETDGKWTMPQPIPGSARLATGGTSMITAISCASPGSCTAGGVYGPSHDEGGFVVSETDGVWGRAEKIPRTPLEPSFEVTAVSCASAGTCGLTGNYTTPGSKPSRLPGSGPESTPFVASQVSGTWADAEPVPGLVDQYTGRRPAVAYATTVSCPAPAECIAGGYTSSIIPTGMLGAFTVTLTGGIWHTAQEVPGIRTLSTSGAASIGIPFCDSLGSCSAVSCGSVGNCGVGGEAISSFDTGQPFTVTRTDGTWHAAQQVTGITAFKTGNDASVQDVSCPPAAPCVSAGFYLNGPGGTPQLFVLS
jgi:hypothetical protein